jgi:hypothetical protein
LAAMVDLPTPPLAEDTARMWDTLGIGRLVGRPRWKRGMLPLAGRPYVREVLAKAAGEG